MALPKFEIKTHPIVLQELIWYAQTLKLDYEAMAFLIESRTTLTMEEIRRVEIGDELDEVLTAVGDSITKSSILASLGKQLGNDS